MQYTSVLSLASSFQSDNKFRVQGKFVFSLYYFIGLSTGLFIFRKVIKIFDLLYIASILLLALRSLCLSTIYRKNISDWPFIAKLLVILLSLNISMLFSFDFYFKNLIALSSQILMSLVFLKRPCLPEANAYINGLKLTFLINYIFAFIQLLFLLIYKVNIFYYLGYYIGFYKDLDQTALLNNTRITGFIWDPYVLGMYCALGFFLFKKIWIKLFIIVLLFFSYSRAGQLAFIVGFIFYYMPFLYKRFLKDKLLPAKVMFAGLILFFFLPFFLKVLQFDRGFDKSSSGWRRVEYITKIPSIWLTDKNIAFPLFGGAPFYTGARYSWSEVDSMAKTAEEDPYWSVESDWFGIIIGRGIFGFIMYLLLYFKIFLSKISRFNKTIALMVFIGGVGYIYDTAIFTCFLVYFSGNLNSISLHSR